MDVFKDKWQYFGLFIDLPTKIKLLNLLDAFPYKRLVNHVKNDSIAIYIDHCTLLHRSHLKTEEGKSFANYISEIYNNSQNKNFKITVSHIGLSDKAAAFKVILHDIKSINSNPHITICTFSNGKPVDSNYIQNWIPIENPIIINSELKFV